VNAPEKSISLRWAACMFLLIGTACIAQTPQQHVHSMAHSVMPFDMSKTVPVFRMTETGGVQSVVAKDAAAVDQIAMIRQHLRHEATQFEIGNYGDPAALHGADMPGLKDVEAGAKSIRVSYAELPSGASITFEAADVHLITAIHRWFGAQLSEHGADARAE
jgi:hypothetical protein